MENIFSGLLAFFEKGWKPGVMLVVACALLYALDFYNMPDNDSLKPLLPYAALCGVIGISMIAGAVIGAIADAIKNCQKRIAERKKKQDAYDKDGIAAVEYVKYLEKNSYLRSSSDNKSL